MECLCLWFQQAIEMMDQQLQEDTLREAEREE
jgi:hypothetical protein